MDAAKITFESCFDIAFSNAAYHSAGDGAVHIAIMRLEVDAVFT